MATYTGGVRVQETVDIQQEINVGTGIVNLTLYTVPAGKYLKLLYFGCTSNGSFNAFINRNDDLSTFGQSVRFPKFSSTVVWSPFEDITSTGARFLELTLGPLTRIDIRKTGSTTVNLQFRIIGTLFTN